MIDKLHFLFQTHTRAPSCDSSSNITLNSATFLAVIVFIIHPEMDRLCFEDALVFKSSFSYRNYSIIVIQLPLLSQFEGVPKNC